MREPDLRVPGRAAAVTLPKRLKSQAAGFDERGIPAALGGNGPPSQMGRVMAPAKVPCWHEVWELLLPAGSWRRTASAPIAWPEAWGCHSDVLAKSRHQPTMRGRIVQR